MPLWHCPHCGTPQAEAARCWVCQRSSTSCATCHNFRRAVAGQLGYCALDRRREPIRGTELRGCWQSAAAVAPGRDPAAVTTAATPGRDSAAAATRIPTGALSVAGPGGLWGDLEP